MGFLEALKRWLIGVRMTLPAPILDRFPELARIHFRQGGVPLRIGGLALGRHSVGGVTLWRTVFLAPRHPLSTELLLHESRHVEQFEASLAFPLRYLWETLRRGYHRNRFEIEARAYAQARLQDAMSSSTEDA